MNLKISYNWLREYFKTNQSVTDFAKEFSLKSQSVEKIKLIGQGLGGVVVGKILEIEKHPNADRLSLAKVDIGRRKPLELIFGQMAKVVVGDQLPVAVAPVKLPTGIEVQAANIRGVNSEGMFCLNSELGLSDRDEVMFFDASVAPGTSIVDALKLNDYLLEIEVTSNRPDAMSVVGLAREAAAGFGKKFLYREPKPSLVIPAKAGIQAAGSPIRSGMTKNKQNLLLKVEVKEPKLCPRYQAMVMTNVKVGPSPLWLQMRLILAGLRPINNLVDITNYVLLELGQPLHVFDYDKLNGQKIIVRPAKNGEKIMALDGKNYDLNENNLIIADQQNPVAIAGVMGGEFSATTAETKTIVFESANFQPLTVRKTTRAINLRSESSDLFEKGLSTFSTKLAILRAVELTQKLADGEVASSLIDLGAKAALPTKINFDLANVKQYLALEIPEDKIRKILESLGFKVKGKKILNLEVPWWRANDITAQHDIIEEIARIYGYDELPRTLPSGELPGLVEDSSFAWESLAKNLLVGWGFTEVYNYSMVSAQLLTDLDFPVKKAVRIANPLNEEMAYLRLTLLPQILVNIKINQKNFSRLKIFELSHVYLTENNKLPKELLRLTAAVGGGKDNFLAVKGIAELLLEKFGINNYQFKITDENCPIWEKGKGLDVYQENNFLGQFGLIRSDVLEKFDLDFPVACLDFDFTTLVKLANKQKIYVPMPEFPDVNRDLAIVVDQKITWQEVSELVNQSNPLLEKVEYLSTFVSPALGENKKSLAFRLTFRAPDRTLKVEEVEAVVEKVVSSLEKKFGARLR